MAPKFTTDEDGVLLESVREFKVIYDHEDKDYRDSYIKANIDYDLKIFSEINNIENCIVLQQQIKKIERWCTSNKLEMNVTKCKVVTYTRKTTQCEFQYTFNNTVLSRDQTIKDLGILFDSKLNFA